MNKKEVWVPLADGCEEMEAVIIVDVLRRAGITVTTGTITGKPVTASRGVKLIADANWNSPAARASDAILIPGGAGGAELLCHSAELLEDLRVMAETNKLIGAICAGPLVLKAAGLISKRTITSYPALEAEFHDSQYLSDHVVQDGNIITSRGPGTAFDFALKVVEHLAGKSCAEEVKSGLLL